MQLQCINAEFYISKSMNFHFLFLPDNGEYDNRRRRQRAQQISPGLCGIIDPEMVNGNNVLYTTL